MEGKERKSREFDLLPVIWKNNVDLGGLEGKIERL